MVCVYVVAKYYSVINSLDVGLTPRVVGTDPALHRAKSARVLVQAESVAA